MSPKNNGGSTRKTKRYANILWVGIGLMLLLTMTAGSDILLLKCLQDYFDLSVRNEVCWAELPWFRLIIVLIVAW